MNVIEAMKNLGQEAWLGKQYRWVDIGAEMEVSANAARKQWQRIRAKASADGVSIKDYVDGLGDVEDENTIPNILDLLNSDPRFAVSGGRVGIWTQGDKTNYTVRANLAPAKPSPEDIMAAIVEGVNAATLPVPKELPPAANPLMAVISLYDVHLERTPDISVEEILGKLEQFLGPYSNRIEEVVFPVGNDLGNSDNVQGTTTKGTPQQNIMGIQEGISARVRLVAEIIDYLASRFPKVIVPMVPGNHDQYSTLWLAQALQQRYRQTKHVFVSDANYRQYRRWRDVAIMYHHGETRYDPINVFLSEAPDVLLGADWVEIHSGHFHGRKETVRLVSENFGVLSRTMPSLADQDEWHKYMGFGGNNRGFQVNVYKEGGVECMTTL